MDKNNFFTEMQNKINQAIENSPARDIEKNVKAMMAQGFSKLDLVTREEFDVQAQVLAKTRTKLETRGASCCTGSADEQTPIGQIISG